MPKKLVKKIRKVTKTKDVCTHEHNIFHKLVCRHIHHIHRHGHKLLHLTHKYNHHAIHLGELIVVWFLCFSHFISSWFAANTETTIITDHTIVASNLVSAMNQWQMKTTDSKIISMWMMDGSVDNSFYPWYCTYGAARISPEFFPFIEDKKQQRTRWGNAKDRCANAQATGYSIWSTPREWALIVYSKIGNSALFGHVGKVMYHNASKRTLIIRDMNRVGKFTMTDRRDTTDNANISCYIYNKRPVVIVTPPTNTWTIANTWIVINTGTTIPIVTPPTIPTTPTVPTNTWTVIVHTWTTTPTIPTVTPPTVIVTPPSVTPIGQYTTSNITLNFDNITDMAKHFLTQRNIEAKLTSKNTLKVWETATLTLTIKDANTQAGFEWLLDLPFELVTSNNNIDTSYSLIQLIKEGKIDIILTAKNIWDTTIIINFDGEKIGKINLTIE